MDFALSPRALDYQQRVRTFVDDHMIPLEREYPKLLEQYCFGDQWSDWRVPPAIERLKQQARKDGLWNLFLPDPQLGAGLSHIEYATIAEEMGRSLIAPEIFNCNAPDTGNMEVLWKYGSRHQQEQWLRPLLSGEIRSAFCMTEPDVASSDATNMRATATSDGDEIVINGRKWWSTGIGHPQCRFVIFMGLSDEQAPRHEQHSMVIVPMDAPGLRVERMLSVLGDYDPPYGHGEVSFNQVRVPKGNLIHGLGKGFEIAQGRLGPGRIHHCMRCIGAAERVLAMAIKRGMSRQAFGQPLIKLDGNRQAIANARIAIDQARLLTLHAAWHLDQHGPMKALGAVSAIKVVAPNVLQQVVDLAIQIHGAAGLSSDLPLTAFYAMARSLRLADGPDEVHRALISKLELKQYR